MWQFAKGHGTMNDFVLLSDPDDERGLSDAEVRLLCDRRAGIGGDGVLRAVRARHIPSWTGDGDVWFMDYRNADGSIAEMCGNGLRVFARYLTEEGLEDRPRFDVATRAGLRSAELLADGRVRVWLGRPEVSADAVSVQVGAVTWPATPVDVGNPHAVVLLEPGQDLAGLDLSVQPHWSPEERFPNGVNCEFVDVLGPGHARLRVHERGVGETMSCGTGTVAVAARLAADEGREHGSYVIDVPGGRVTVDLTPEGAFLTGPAVIVARGRLEPAALAQPA